MMLRPARMFKLHPPIMNRLTNRLSRIIIQDQEAPDLDSLEWIPERSRNLS